MRTYDVVVVGGGHNGLIVAAYLSKAGMDVCVVEGKSIVGGCLITKEVTLKGFKHDLGGTMHMTIQANPLIHRDELGLKAKYGLKYVFPDPVLSIVFPDDKALVIYRDIGKTCESISQFSSKDADMYYKFCESFSKKAKVVGLSMFSPPIPFGEMVRSLDGTEDGRDYLRILLSSAQVIAEEWFESLEMRTAFGRWISEEMIGPRENGTGFYIAGWPLFHTWGLGMPVGGSASLCEALSACIKDNGGKIYCGQQVEEIEVKGGIARSVTLKNGEKIESKKAIISAINVKQLFLSLLKKYELIPGFKERIARLKHATFAPLIQAIALDEAPVYKAGGDVNKSVWVEISPYRDELLKMYDDYSYGIPNAGMPVLGTATLADPSRAPDGKHTLYAYHFEPYSLYGKGPAGWDEMKYKIADAVLETACKHLINLRPEDILKRWVASPLDWERMNPSLMEGDIGHIGSFLPQLFGNRPLPGWSSYRTPVQQLYMTGASTHPGCGITGGGRAAVKVIMEDMGLDFDSEVSRWKNS